MTDKEKFDFHFTRVNFMYKIHSGLKSMYGFGLDDYYPLFSELFRLCFTENTIYNKTEFDNFDARLHKLYEEYLDMVEFMKMKNVYMSCPEKTCLRQGYTERLRPMNTDETSDE